jgi:signal transduction histidine kinase
MGLSYFKQKDYQTALNFYEKSCTYRQMGNQKWLSLNYIKIAEALLKLNQRQKAIYYIHLAEEYYYFKGYKTSLLSDVPFYIENTYVEYYSLLDNPKEVHTHTLNARDFALKANNEQEYILTFLKEASFFMNEHEEKKTIQILNQLIPRLEKEKKYKELQISYQYLLTCYLNTNQLQLAHKNYERYIHIAKIVDSTKYSMEQQTLQTLTDLYESEKKLSQAQKKLQISKIKNGLDLSHKKLFIWLFVLGISVILVLVLLLLNVLKNKKRLQQLHFQSLLQNNEIKLKSNELMRSDQIKDKLFSIIAHDLRNPLNRLMVELAIVKKTIGSEMTAPMENTLRETIGLFERLLQWSKMNNKQDNFYAPLKINLNETINKVISFYLPEMQSKKISITNNSDTVFVFVDPNILQTLLRNFFSNSISALAENGKIEVEIFQPDEEHVELQISDSGPGFPLEVLTDFQIEKNEINESGSGLGLTLCKVLAKMSELPLKISNESKYQGALVSIVLPIFKEKKKTQELNLISRSFEPDDFWKQKLKPICSLKFYQTSQIRAFIKSLGTIDNPQVRFWVRQIEKSVHQGDQEAYAALLKLLER